MIISSWLQYYEGRYKVTSDGKIISFLTPDPTILKQTTSTSGHKIVSLKGEDGTSKKYYVHRLVYKTFSKQVLKPGQYIMHRDKNPANNDFSNLYMISEARKERKKVEKETKIKVIEENGTERMFNTRSDVVKFYGIHAAKCNEAIRTGEWVEIITKKNL